MFLIFCMSKWEVHTVHGCRCEVLSCFCPGILFFLEEMTNRQTTVTWTGLFGKHFLKWTEMSWPTQGTQLTEFVANDKIGTFQVRIRISEHSYSPLLAQRRSQSSQTFLMRGVVILKNMRTFTIVSWGLSMFGRSSSLQTSNVWGSKICVGKRAIRSARQTNRFHYNQITEISLIWF